MASEHPVNPQPDDAPPPEASPLSEWVLPEETGPSTGAHTPQPEALPEEALFPDIPPPLEEVVDLGEPLPAAEPPLVIPTGRRTTPDLSQGTGGTLFDLGETHVEAQPAPRSPGTVADLQKGAGGTVFDLSGSQEPVETVLPVEPADALADLPPVEPAAPASGWLDVVPSEPEPLSEEAAAESSAALPAAPAVEPTAPASGWFDVVEELPPPPAVSTESSDILAGTAPGESDVLRVVASPRADSSNIFDAPPEGSARFEDPAEATEDVAEALPPPPESGLFTDLAEPLQPSSAMFAEEITSPAETTHPDEIPAAEPIADTEESEAISFTSSGVDLLDPNRGPGSEAFGPGSSIFSDLSAVDKTGIDATDLHFRALDDGATEDIHLPAGTAGPSSDIFHQGRTIDPTEAHPIASEGEETLGTEQIDWNLPELRDVPERQVSQAISYEDTDEGGVPELRGLVETSPVVAPLPPSGPPAARRAEDEPARSEPRKPPRSKADLPERAPARKGGVGGWIGGTALGVLIGAGGFAGAYFGGLLPGGESVRSVEPSASGPTAAIPRAATISVEEAQASLAAGDPVRALKGFEAAGIDSPEVRAGRGQARWLTRLREVAAAGERPRADDPQIQQAVTDLQAVVEAADTLGTEEQRQAAVRAALHLGLIQEATGDLAGAQRIYAAAVKKFPGSAKVFQAALNRLRAVPQGAGATARLTPEAVQELAQLAGLALILIQADGATAVEEEPGFLFWEACNLAAGQDYLKAADTIRAARTAHEQRRLKLAGRGLNPLSDPLEQIFSRACADLREYWVLKHHVYNNPALGKEFQAAARAGELPKFLTALGTARQQAQQADGQLKTLTAQAMQEKTRADGLQAQLTESDKKVRAAMDVATKSEEDRRLALKEAAEAKKALEERTTQLAEANTRVAEAQKKLEAADQALAAVVKELKTHKLIDEKDEGPAALAKLPEVIRKASAAATSADAQKAAQTLLQVQKELETARAEAKLAREVATKAEQATRQAMAEADKKVAAARDEAKAIQAQTDTLVKKAVEMAQAAAQKQLDEAAAQRTALEQAAREREKEFAAKLAAQEEEHRKQLANARAGVVVPLSAGELAARERAAGSYHTGTELYFAGQYAAAEAAFDRATRDDGHDARYWYFLGLARFAQGKPADEAFKKGAELEARNQPNTRLVRVALERVQGRARQVLATYRP